LDYTQTQKDKLMSMTPFEIRLELLKMAKDMLTDEYFGKREQISNNWQTQIETSRLKGETPPPHPGFPDFPSEAEIEKTSKKST